MIEEHIFGGVTVIYDTESLPLEYKSAEGTNVIRPKLTYEQRFKVYCEIRETAAGLLAETNV